MEQGKMVKHIEDPTEIGNKFENLVPEKIDGLDTGR